MLWHLTSWSQNVHKNSDDTWPLQPFFFLILRLRLMLAAQQN